MLSKLLLGWWRGPPVVESQHQSAYLMFHVPTRYSRWCSSVTPPTTKPVSRPRGRMEPVRLLNRRQYGFSQLLSFYNSRANATLPTRPLRLSHFSTTTYRGLCLYQPALVLCSRSTVESPPYHLQFFNIQNIKNAGDLRGSRRKYSPHFRRLFNKALSNLF